MLPQHDVNQDLLDSADAKAPSKADQLVEEIHMQGLSDPVKCCVSCKRACSRA